MGLPHDLLVLGIIGGDNYEYLYLDTEETALRVNIKSGLLMDPRGDVNLVTIVEVAAPNSSHRK